MKILEIKWKNFNSYGNNQQHLKFDDNGSLYLLHGISGAGKSTIAEVILFTLYGKVEKKKKGDLPNRINKTLECYIKIQSKNKIIEIERGISPIYFNIKVDGNEIDTAGNDNLQDYLESEIFTIPYNVFKNIVVLSINDFRSFLTLTPRDKRDIIDKLFGFSIINEMKNNVRDERKLIKDNIKKIENEIGILNSNIKSIENKIEILEESNKQDLTNEINEYKTKIKAALVDKKSIDSDYNKLLKIEEKVTDILNDNTKKESNSKYKIKDLNKKIKLYNNSNCPTCGSNLHTSEHLNIKESLTSELITEQDYLNSISTELIDIQNKIKIIKNKVKIQYKESTNIDYKIKQYIKDAEKLKKTNNKKYSNSLNDLKRESVNKIKTRKEKETKYNQEDVFLEMLEYILGDDGVKNLATNSILPPLNHNINKMIKQIHLPYNIKFNDKFDCIITSMGEEIAPTSMSTGERKRADFIIVVALLKILKIQYPTLNLLFLDEIFSSLDQSNIYEMIKILQEAVSEYNLHAWVINHSELPVELFDKRIEIIKSGGFSQMSIETL